MRPSNESLRENDAALASLLKDKIGTPDFLECLPIVGQRLEQLLPDVVEGRLLKNTLGDLLKCLPIVDLAYGLLIVLMLNKLPPLQSTPYLKQLLADLCNELVPVAKARMRRPRGRKPLNRGLLRQTLDRLVEAYQHIDDGVATVDEKEQIKNLFGKTRASFGREPLSEDALAYYVGEICRIRRSQPRRRAELTIMFAGVASERSLRPSRLRLTPYPPYRLRSLRKGRSSPSRQNPC